MQSEEFNSLCFVAASARVKGSGTLRQMLGHQESSRSVIPIRHCSALLFVSPAPIVLDDYPVTSACRKDVATIQRSAWIFSARLEDRSELGQNLDQNFEKGSPVKLGVRRPEHEIEIFEKSRQVVQNRQDRSVPVKAARLVPSWLSRCARASAVLSACAVDAAHLAVSALVCTS